MLETHNLISKDSFHIGKGRNESFSQLSIAEMHIPTGAGNFFPNQDIVILECGIRLEMYRRVKWRLDVVDLIEVVESVWPGPQYKIG